MYHSITFGDKNTWDDWNLIPNGRPFFVPPKQKTSYLDIPGGNGSLDMSEALTGYPVFNNREGSFTFIIMNEGASYQPKCKSLRLEDVASRIMEYLHGKRMRAVLEDDDQYFYEGRFEVESVTPGADWSTITIGYNVDPYKYENLSTVDSWLWDPFNFVTGEITQSIFKDLTVDTTERSVSYDARLIGDRPVSPAITVDTDNQTGAYIRCVNPALDIDVTKLFQNGTTTDYDIVLYGNTTLYYYTESGSGTISLEFYRGAL